MLKSTIRIFLLIASSVLISCASMTPTQVHELLPTMTESTFLTLDKAERAIESESCRVLVKGREYAAPQGITVKDDLRKAAKGIDEWVMLDGGNAYVLTNYHWKSVGDQGGTQLFVVFNTLKIN